MTKPPGGVFPLHEDVLKKEARAEYRQHMNTFFLRLAELNINIYIVEQVLAFPYDLLAEGRTDDGFFFPLLMKNTFEACTLMVAKVATDQGSDVYTLPRLRNMLLRMVKPEHQPEIQARLGGLRFDQKTKELLEKARKLRDTHIAHFVHAASQEEHMTLSEIKALRDELNTLLQGLSFEAEFIMLPHSYETHRSDVEWVLDSIAKGSDLLNMPEQDPACWQYRRQKLTDIELTQLNHYRKKFGLSEV
jgi:hypothetical protein